VKTKPVDLKNMIFLGMAASEILQPQSDFRE